MDFNAFHFLRPQWFWALPALLLVAGIWLRQSLSRGDWAKVVDDRLLPYILEQRPERNSRLFGYLFVFAALLSLIALAGPTWERLPAPVFRNESALVIVLDLSRSMEAQDVRPSRLERARFKISDILQQRKDGLTALVVYSNEAYTVAPLTDDTATISSQLPALEPSIMPARGSQASRGLIRAVELLKQSGNVRGNVLLVADSVDEKAQAIATEMNREGYRLFVLGVGTVEGAPIPTRGGGFLKDSRGNIVVAKLEAKPMTSLARSGGGFYRSLANDDRDIRSFMASFDDAQQLPQSDQSEKQVDQWVEVGPWLLLVVLPIAAFAFRRGYLWLCLLLVLPYPQGAYAWQWEDLWQTRDQRGYSAFEKENYEEAAELFENPEWKAAAEYNSGHYQEAFETLKKSDGKNNHYNMANALAQTGRLQEALDEYDKALEQDPTNEDARKNRAITEEVLKQQKQQQNQSSEENQDSNDKQSSEEENQKSESGDSKNQQDRQQASESDASDQQEETSGSQQNDQMNSGDEKSAEQRSEEEAEEKDKKKAEQNSMEANDPSSEKESRSVADSEINEQQELQQANEQWLRRIPDDPGGLLRRKFKYQYSKRPPDRRGEREAW